MNNQTLSLRPEATTQTPQPQQRHENPSETQQIEEPTDNRFLVELRDSNDHIFRIKTRTSDNPADKPSTERLGSFAAELHLDDFEIMWKELQVQAEQYVEDLAGGAMATVKVTGRLFVTWPITNDGVERMVVTKRQWSVASRLISKWWGLLQVQCSGIHFSDGQNKWVAESEEVE